MYKPYQVIVFDRDTGEIHSKRSIFADRQRAVDCAWAWYHKGKSARIFNRASGMIEQQMLQDFADGLPF